MAASESLQRSQSTDVSDRKYQLISRTSIKYFAESKGYVVSDDVIRVLTEDVNYRLREIVSVSGFSLSHHKVVFYLDSVVYILMFVDDVCLGSISVCQTFTKVSTLCIRHSACTQ